MAKRASSVRGPIGLAGTDPSPTKRRWDVGKIWTPKLGKPFTPVSCYFIDNYHRLPFPITPIEFTLIVHLLKYKWDEAMPFPAFTTLAKKIGRSGAAVRGAARALEHKRYLRRHFKKGRPNHFDFQPLFDLLEEMLDADVVAAKQRSKNEKRKIA